MPNHTVQPGDCFNSIAKEHGFFNYKTIHNHGQNATKWPNPNTLEEGKTVDVPAKTEKKVALKLNSTNKFVVDRQKTKLRIMVLDAELKAMKIKTSALHLDIDYTKKPSGKGLLDLAEVNPATKTGTLKITLDLPKPKAASTSKAKVDPRAYPIKIVVADFEDKDPDPVVQGKLEWKLSIGHLESHTTVRGVAQRLCNLGFSCPNVTVENDDTKSAVSAYQLYFKLKAKGAETGKIADIRTDIRDRHDNA